MEFNLESYSELKKQQIQITAEEIKEYQAELNDISVKTKQFVEVQYSKCDKPVYLI